MNMKLMNEVFAPGWFDKSKKLSPAGVITQVFTKYTEISWKMDSVLELRNLVLSGFFFSKFKTVFLCFRLRQTVYV